MPNCKTAVPYRGTPEQEERVMDDFEALAFAGLEADQRNILWVRHVHAGHHELHFVIPRVELASGKAFNPCPPGWQKHFDLFRDLHNHREGWARPDDPTRTRMFTPAHADLHRARLLRWGKIPKPDERAAAKEMVAGVSDEYIGTNETMLTNCTILFCDYFKGEAIKKGYEPFGDVAKDIKGDLSGKVEKCVLALWGL